MKVTMIGAQGKDHQYEDLNFKKEAKYLDREVADFRAKVQGSNQDN